MTRTHKNILQQSYRSYRKSKRTKRSVLSFFRSFIPEIIFRTTKLEGEPVTRRLVRALFR